NLLWVGLLFTIAADGVRAVAQERPIGPSDGPSAPNSLPYSLFLPSVMKRFLSGYQSPFGVDMYAGNTPSNGQAQMAAAGSGWETVAMVWTQIEPTAPISGVHTYNWDGLDWAAERAQADHMNLFVMFTGNPSWAAELLGGPVSGTHATDLTNLAAAAAERYDGDGLNDAPGSPVINYWSFY